MSVYIKGMEMPRGCASCKISRRNGKKMICPFIWKCEWDIHDPMSADHRLDGCPLIPVPDHGDLIDRVAFREEMDKHYPFDRYTQSKHEWEDAAKSAVIKMLVAAPTIIPADKEGEE